MARPGRDLEEIAAVLVLGVGLAALFLGYDWFWMAWILGFVVVVPLVELLTPDGDGDPDVDADDAAESRQDALDALRERYAHGDLTDEQFERKLDRLLETETPEDVLDRVERERE